MEEQLHEIARRKARYGHRPWLHWRDRNNTPHIAIFSSLSIKTAMLAIGTQGNFTCYHGNGTAEFVTWSVASSMFKNALYNEKTIGKA